MPLDASASHLVRDFMQMNEMEVWGNWNVLKGRLKKMVARVTQNQKTFLKGSEEEYVGQRQIKIVAIARQAHHDSRFLHPSLHPWWRESQ